MLNFSEYRPSADRLADHLPWAALVAPGVVLALFGHSLAVFAAKRDPDFLAVLVRHLRQKGQMSC